MKVALKGTNQRISATDINALRLSISTRKLHDLVAEYVAIKLRQIKEVCYSDKLFDDCNNAKYIKLLSREDLLEPSLGHLLHLRLLRS